MMVVLSISTVTVLPLRRLPQESSRNNAKSIVGSLHMLFSGRLFFLRAYAVPTGRYSSFLREFRSQKATAAIVV